MDRKENASERRSNDSGFFRNEFILASTKNRDTAKQHEAASAFVLISFLDLSLRLLEREGNLSSAKRTGGVNRASHQRLVSPRSFLPSTLVVVW